MTTQPKLEPGFLEIHIIQNFPPSNLNRDDVGQPKDCEFGGHRRARISSQSLKRSIRYVGKDPKDQKAKSLFEQYTGVSLSDRTRLIIRSLTGRLVEKQRPEKEAKLLATAFASAFAGEVKDGVTNVLLYLTDDEQELISDELNRKWDSLLAALSPETPLTVIVRLLGEKITNRAQQPDKNSGLPVKDFGKEVQARLVQQGKTDKEAKSVVGDLKKSFLALQNPTKFLYKEELDWVASEVNRRWIAIEAVMKAESPMMPMVNKFIADCKERPSAPDIALFGRMLADKPTTNIDAACQVAHAISTHTVNRSEIDYFTAVDDLQTKEETGSAFLDMAYFNSACFYRYARLDLEQLRHNLNYNDEVKDLEMIERTVEGFLRASEAAIPTGKKNSSAHESRPSFLMAVIRSKQSAGWSLVNAFEKPVQASNGKGLIEQSVQRLDRSFGRLSDFYDDNSVLSLAIALPDDSITPEILSEKLSQAVKPKMSEWVKTICAAIKGEITA